MTVIRMCSFLLAVFAKLLQELKELRKYLAGLQARMKRNSETTKKLRVLQAWKVQLIHMFS